MDVIGTTRRESEEWMLANYHELEIHETPLMDGTLEMNHAVFTCFVDMSWKGNEKTSGIGCVLELQDGTTYLIGLKGTCRSISPLHMELRALIWAMQKVYKGKIDYVHYL